MGNVLVKEESLTAIADAIRTKNDSTTLYKPSEMPDAILKIETGSKEVDESKPIKFFGYEGVLLYSYTYEELATLTELPPLPVVEGLICQGWNWSLQNIKELGREVNVGAIFITDDGATRIYVSLRKGTLNLHVGFGQTIANGVLVDWGDGSELESSAMVTTVTPIRIPHTYEKEGDYVIRFIPNGNVGIYLIGNNYGTYILNKTSKSTDGNRCLGNTIKKIELGSNIEGIKTRAFFCDALEYVTIPQNITDIKDAFKYCSGLKYIALPNGITTLDSGAFANNFALERIALPDSLTELDTIVFQKCYQLKEITFPRTVTAMGANCFNTTVSLEKLVIPSGVLLVPNSFCTSSEKLKEVVVEEGVQTLDMMAFSGCSVLEKITLPESLTTINSNCFSSCESLKELTIPLSITSISGNMCYNCLSLAQMVIHENVTDIASKAFSNCYGMEDYYVIPKTPPTLANVNAFEKIEDTCKIHVPKGCLEAYQTATNWSTYASYMVEMEV